MQSTFTEHLNGDDGHNYGQNSMDADVSPPHCPVMPIAVIGLAGRFPGDATTPQALWEMCCHGKSAWSEIPEDRMNASAYFHPDPSKSGCVCSWIGSDSPTMGAYDGYSSTVKGHTF